MWRKPELELTTLEASDILPSDLPNREYSVWDLCRPHPHCFLQQQVSAPATALVDSRRCDWQLNTIHLFRCGCGTPTLMSQNVQVLSTGGNYVLNGPPFGAIVWVDFAKQPMLALLLTVLCGLQLPSKQWDTSPCLGVVYFPIFYLILGVAVWRQY